MMLVIPLRLSLTWAHSTPPLPSAYQHPRQVYSVAIYVPQCNDLVLYTNCIELIDKGISVSTLEESGLGGEEEMLHKLTTRMDTSFQSPVSG